MSEQKENRTSDSVSELDNETLENVSGGARPFDAGVMRRRYERETGRFAKADCARKYLEYLGVEIVKKKYPCPVCHSWNVLNADPGIFRQIRVVCYDCGAFRCRDGSEPWGIGESKV